MSSGQRRSCCSLPGLPRHPGEICFAAGSLNPPSLEMLHRPGGSPWWAPGPTALPVSEGCPAGSRSCPRALYFPWPARRPVRPAPYRPYYCAYGRSTSPRPSRYQGHRGGTLVVVAGRHSSWRNVHPLVHPGGMPWPGTLSVSTLGWLAPTRPAATGCEPWSWPP